MSLNVAQKYAEALFSRVDGGEAQERLLQDFVSLDQLLQADTLLIQFLAHPRIELMEKKFLFEGVLDKLKVTEIFKAYALLVVNNHRFDIFDKLHKEYESLVHKSQGVVQGEVAVTSTVDQTVIQSVQETFQKLCPAQIRWTQKEDNQLLAGFQVRIEDYFYDASLRNQLNKVHSVLVNDI
jgi:F-type H+-transporting ATPase subunit delta